MGALEDLRIFYAARPRPGDVIEEKSIRDAYPLRRPMPS